MVTFEQYTDENLMLELAGGNTSALSTLIQRHQQKAIALAYRTLHSSNLAEDIAQEAFIRVYKAAKRYKPDARFTTWFYRIVVNLCLDEMRKSGRNPVNLKELPDNPSGAPDDNPLWTLSNQERSQLIENAIDKLNDRQKTVLMLHRFDGLSHGEIAKTTGWSESAVESLLVRAYQKLRESLKNIDFPEKNAGKPPKNR